MDWVKLRAKRNKLLEQTDKFMLADFPLDAKTRGLYKEYRSYLRNVPALYDDKTISKAKVKSYEEWLEWKRGGSY